MKYTLKNVQNELGRFHFYINNHNLYLLKFKMQNMAVTCLQCMHLQKNDWQHSLNYEEPLNNTFSKCIPQKKKIKKLGWGRVMVVSVIKSIAYSCAHLCLHLHVGQDILWDPMSDSGWLHSLLAAQSKQNLSHLSFTPTFHARWMHVNVPLFPCGECFV